MDMIRGRGLRLHVYDKLARPRQGEGYILLL